MVLRAPITCKLLTTLHAWSCTVGLKWCSDEYCSSLWCQALCSPCLALRVNPKLALLLSSMLGYGSSHVSQSGRAMRLTSWLVSSLLTTVEVSCHGKPNACPLFSVYGELVARHSESISVSVIVAYHGGGKLSSSLLLAHCLPFIAHHGERQTTMMIDAQV